MVEPGGQHELQPQPRPVSNVRIDITNPFAPPAPPSEPVANQPTEVPVNTPPDMEARRRLVLETLVKRTQKTSIPAESGTAAPSNTVSTRFKKGLGAAAQRVGRAFVSGQRQPAESGPVGSHLTFEANAAYIKNLAELAQFAPDDIKDASYADLKKALAAMPKDQLDRVLHDGTIPTDVVVQMIWRDGGRITVESPGRFGRKKRDTLWANSETAGAQQQDERVLSINVPRLVQRVRQGDQDALRQLQQGMFNMSPELATRMINGGAIPADIAAQLRLPEIERPYDPKNVPTFLNRNNTTTTEVEPAAELKKPDDAAVPAFLEARKNAEPLPPASGKPLNMDNISELVAQAMDSDTFELARKRLQFRIDQMTPIQAHKLLENGTIPATVAAQLRVPPVSRRERIRQARANIAASIETKVAAPLLGTKIGDMRFRPSEHATSEQNKVIGPGQPVIIHSPGPLESIQARLKKHSVQNERPVQKPGEFTPIPPPRRTATEMTQAHLAHAARIAGAQLEARAKQHRGEESSIERTANALADAQQRAGKALQNRLKQSQRPPSLQPI